jgi:hypothetical protein
MSAHLRRKRGWRRASIAPFFSLSDCFKLLLSVMGANINKILIINKQQSPSHKGFAYFETIIAYFES